MKTKNENLKDVNQEVKEVYEKPSIEIIEMEMEGILCSSGEGFRNGGGGRW